MKNLKSIFDHPKPSNPEREPHLYDWRRPFHSKDDAAYLNKLLKRRGRKASPERVFSGKAGYNGSENSRKQRVFFTTTYAKTLKSHKEYIKNYMPQKDKPGVTEEAEMFGVPPEEYLNNIVPLHFKWIISPESQKVDLKLLANTLIKHVEQLTGYEFYWRGVIHTDTGHHHLHIVVNGKDKNGKSVRFPKDMIKNTIREMTSNIITNMIGERTPEEIENAKSKLPLAKRWTEFDERPFRFWILCRKSDLVLKKIYTIINGIHGLACRHLFVKEKIYSLRPGASIRFLRIILQLLMLIKLVKKQISGWQVWDMFAKDSITEILIHRLPQVHRELSQSSATAVQVQPF